MAIKPDLDKLRLQLEYFPDTGELVRKFRYTKDWLPGKPDPVRVGSPHKDGTGRLVVNFMNRCYYAHQLIWYMQTGHWPEYIDHKDNNPGNNSWDNLRECTNQQNQFNKPKGKTNTSGFKGVSWSKCKGKWVARIQVAGTYKFLGYYSSPEAAHAAYCAAADKHHGEYANHG